MKKIICIISLLILLGCTGTTAKYSNMEIKNGLFYVKDQFEPYTGKAIKNYSETDQVQIEGVFVDGKPKGIFKSYYENGQVEVEGTYVDGNLEGPYKIYYESGQLKEEGTFKDDLFIGVWKEYYENGQIKEYINYEIKK